MNTYGPYPVDPKRVAPYEPRPKREKRSYTVLESVFAWLCMGLGFLFWRWSVCLCALGSMLFLWAAFACAAIVLKCRGAKFRTLPVTAMVSALVLSPALILSYNPLICFCTLAYGAAAWCYFVSHTAGDPEQIAARRWGADLWRALVLPFSSMDEGQLFRGMISSIDRRRSGAVLKVLGGIVIAIIPTAIVVALLSYDSAFQELLNNVLRLDWEVIFTNLLCLIGGIPVGMYLFGLYLSATDRRMPDFLSEEVCSQLSARTKILPMLTAVTAVVPLLVVYVLFFVSQWKYYVSGFTGVLPEGFSYAGYAREGFFQLCIVSVINLGAILLTLILMKRSKGADVLLKVLTTIFAVFTLVLIATAMAKLVMYIGSYGLTPRRVYAAWFMVVIGLVFIVVTISRFVPKISASALSLAVVLVCFGGLALSNADYGIAKYNVDRYLNGTLNSVDVEALYEQLDAAAVPELVRLAEELDKRNGTDITKVTYMEANTNYDMYHRLAAQLMRIQSYTWWGTEKGKHADADNIFGFTVNHAMAKKAMERLGEMNH
ncbi:MAG: DUF4173 domain-containing protein [Clostridia bacterium]|nr:DUF4173 domain-containing protein [Clostridia bacterium]